MHYLATQEIHTFQLDMRYKRPGGSDCIASVIQTLTCSREGGREGGREGRREGGRGGEGEGEGEPILSVGGDLSTSTLNWTGLLKTIFFSIPCDFTVIIIEGRSQCLSWSSGQLPNRCSM